MALPVQDSLDYRARKILASMAGIFWSVDCDGIYTLCEGRGLAEINMDGAARIGKSIFEVHADRPDILGRVRSALDGIATQQQMQIHGRWFESQISPLVSPEGVITGVSGITWDIHDRKKAAAMESSEQKFRKIFESGLFGMIFWKADGEVSDANDTFLEMLGFTREDLTERRINWFELTPPEFHEIDRHAIEQLATRGLCEPYEKEYYRVDGTRIPVTISGTVLSDVPGVGGIALIVDMSGKRQAEADRAKLQASEHAALQASKLKSAFLANMSHEMRTPLNAIVGIADLLLRFPLNADQAESISILKSAADGLGGLISDVLDFSKIESGKIELESVPFALRDQIEAVAREHRLSAKDKGILFSVEGLDRIPSEAVGDPVRVRQIAMNLVSNAIKFTSQGSVNLRLAADGTEATSFVLRIEVEDTGIGIAKTDLPKLFDPFVQVDSSTTRRYGGTGLGLSICKRLIELMGGEIAVESVPAKGSRFRVAIPLSREVGNVQGRFPAVETKQVENRFPADARVLLVEDTRQNQRVLLKMLAALGLAADVAENGYIALEALRQRPYSVILMDCHMPEMDGYAASRAIRCEREPRLRNTPIIAMTASALSGDREKCLAAGMNDYLAKPVGLSQLSDCLAAWINGAVNPSGTLFPARHAEVPPESVDVEVLSKMLKLGREEGCQMIDEMLELFTKNVPLRLGRISVALEKRDLALAAREAHGLKSATCYLGAARIGWLCDKLRESANQGRAERAQGTLAEIATEQEHVSVEVRRWLLEQRSWR